MILVLLAVTLAAVLGITATPRVGHAAPVPMSPAVPMAPVPMAPSAVSAAPSEPQSLRVASFNVRCESCYEGRGAELTWQQRRAAVVATIKSQDLDVLGLQEASQGWLHNSRGKKYSMSQYEDLLKRLGSPWKLTNSKRNNCVNAARPKGCVYRNRGASLGTRILYNSDRIAVMETGSKLLPETNTKGTRHYVTWARLQQLSTGLEFMLSDSHLTAYKENAGLRKTQAAVALAVLRAHNRDQLSMIALGDWNTSRFDNPGNSPYDVYHDAGFVDPLFGSVGPRNTTVKAPVERRINTWLNSFNGWDRHARGVRGGTNGNYLDYILTTPMRVSEWETVANLDSNGNFIGRIPSDHNMIRATVWLPDPTA
jgi:endonuclease/exonuclease/phosphatase family metal-dependent hydrolase